jgi:peroxiredoxin
MSAMQKKYGDQGLVVLAVNVDSRSTDALEFLKSTSAGFTVLMDPLGNTPRAYQAKAMPTSILIGRDGRILDRHSGFKASETPTLEAGLRKALGLQ